MALEQELAHFESLKEDLLKNHQGKFALIHGEDFIGAFDTPENAYIAGVEQFGTDPFLIKQILEEEPVEHVPAFFLGVMNAHIF